jgi:hypothetical protein
MIRENTTLQAEVVSVKAKLDSLEVLAKSAYEGLRIAGQRYATALGMTVAGLDTMVGEALVIEFNTIKTAFDKRFLSGGRAQADAQESADPIKQSSSSGPRVAGVKATTL